MAYWFPTYLPSSLHTVDIDDINGTFTVLWDTTVGGLTSDNIAEGAFLKGDVALGDVYRWHRATNVVDHTWNRTSGWTAALAAGVRQFHRRGVWEPVEGYTKEIDTRGGVFRIVASFQADDDDDYYGGTTNPAGASYGAKYAIRVNGRIIWESSTGSGEEDNERYEPAATTAVVGATRRGKYVPVRIKAMVALPPGRHLLELVIRTPPISTTSYPKKTVHVSNGTFYALEMVSSWQ